MVEDKVLGFLKFLGGLFLVVLSCGSITWSNGQTTQLFYPIATILLLQLINK